MRLVLLGCLLCASRLIGGELLYSPAPIDNPLKGIAANWSISAAARASFPHSLNTKGFAVNAVMSGPTNFDWTTVESFLNTVTNNGEQAIPIFYIDYPDTVAASQVPDYVLTNGLQTWSYSFEGRNGLFPDYANTNLQQCLDDFIVGLGAKYDGDPRIAFLRVGIVGVYGEWHWGPSSMQSHWPTVAVQKRILDSFTNAFPHAVLMVRYPVGDSDTLEGGVVPMARNQLYPMGYHDDSFCRTTIATNWPSATPKPDWMMQTEMVVANATNKWKWKPIGGELSSSLYTKCFTNSPLVGPTAFGVPWDESFQSFSNCVYKMHASWIHDWGCFYIIGLYGSGVYDFGPGGTNALLGARMLGYELWAKSYSLSGNTVQVTITNTGVAPFYYPWQVKVAAVTNGVLAKSWDVDWDIRTVIPGDGDVTFSATLDSPPTVPHMLLMRVVQPMAGGKQLHFANVNEGLTLTNWLTLGPGGSPYRVSNLRVSTIRGK